jgi:hypothetical protein
MNPLPIDASIELVMKWPFLLHGVRPMNLVMLGSVVRSDSKGSAVRVIRHEFRTAPVHAIKEAAI